MNLWLVMVIAGTISTSTAMPDDITYPECLQIAGNSIAAVGSHDPEKAATMEFRCIWRDDQPLEGEQIQRRH